MIYDVGKRRTGSQHEPIRNPDEPGVIPLDIRQFLSIRKCRNDTPFFKKRILIISAYALMHSHKETMCNINDLYNVYVK